MSPKTTDPIVVTALNDSREFSTLEDLGQFVEGAMRRAQFTPMEAAALRKLAALGNGEFGGEAQRAHRNLSFVEPERERTPTPFDEKLREAEQVEEERRAKLDRAESKWREDERKLRADYRKRTATAGGDWSRLTSLTEELNSRLRGLPSRERFYDAEREYKRARARRMALTLASQRWAREQTSRFYIGRDRNGERVYGTAADLAKAREDK